MFLPISKAKFIRQTLAANPDLTHDALEAQLDDMLAAKTSGERCDICGGTMWVIGSAMVGWTGCFTCITGEADASDDYELDAAL